MTWEKVTWQKLSMLGIKEVSTLQYVQILKRKISEYYRQPYAKKFYYPTEVGKSLEKHKLLNLTQYETDYHNSTILNELDSHKENSRSK